MDYVVEGRVMILVSTIEDVNCRHFIEGNRNSCVRVRPGDLKSEAMENHSTGDDGPSTSSGPGACAQHPSGTCGP